MHKKRTGSKFLEGLTAAFLTILGIAVIAFAGLGIWKTVDLAKDYQNKQSTEIEQEAGPESCALSIEEEIVNNMAA